MTSCYYQNILAVAIKAQAEMSYHSSSLSISSEDGSELSSNVNSGYIEERGATFIPYDEDLEPVATLEEARGGSYSTKFYTGRHRPEVQPLTLLYTIFDRKGSPFVYLPLKNGTPFTYVSTLHPFS